MNFLQLLHQQIFDVCSIRSLAATNQHCILIWINKQCKSQPYVSVNKPNYYIGAQWGTSEVWQSRIKVKEHFWLEFHVQKFTQNQEKQSF